MGQTCGPSRATTTTADARHPHGIQSPARVAMRLLHPRHAGDGLRYSVADSPNSIATGFAPSWVATFVGAPAIFRSSRPSKTCTRSVCNRVVEAGNPSCGITRDYTERGINMSKHIRINRRQILAAGAGALSTGILPRVATSARRSRQDRRYSLLERRPGLHGTADAKGKRIRRDTTRRKTGGRQSSSSTEMQNPNRKMAVSSLSA